MILRPCSILLFTLLTLQTALGDDASAGTGERLFRLTLPPTVYAVPGVEMSLHFENTVLVAEGQHNGVHPNAAGYQQIEASIYCWMKSRLAQ